MTTEVLRTSIAGVRREINLRTLKICGLCERVTGNERRFVKPRRNQYPSILLALRLYKEVEKLRIIKSELKKLVQMEPQSGGKHSEVSFMDLGLVQKSS